jgi:hypothetical protein
MKREGERRGEGRENSIHEGSRESMPVFIFRDPERGSIS